MFLTMRADRLIQQVTQNKRAYFDLLLLGDEQVSMIEGYLERGEMFVIRQAGEVAGACVVTQEGPDRYELQNIAVYPAYQRQGIGRDLVRFLQRRYPAPCVLFLGTGDSPSTLGFYRALGFHETGRDAGYFLRHYDHPIFEEGKQLIDRVCFQWKK